MRKKTGALKMRGYGVAEGAWKGTRLWRGWDTLGGVEAAVLKLYAAGLLVAGVGSAALGGWWAVRAGAEDGPGPASMQTRGIFSWVEAGLAAGSLLRHTPPPSPASPPSHVNLPFSIPNF